MLMTVKEARKVLGKEISEKMSDDEIENTILTLSDLAKHALEQARKDRLTDKVELSNSTSPKRS